MSGTFSTTGPAAHSSGLPSAEANGQPPFWNSNSAATSQQPFNQAPSHQVPQFFSGESQIGGPPPASYSMPVHRVTSSHKPSSTSASVADELNRLNEQGRDLFNTVSTNPLAQMGLSYSKNVWERSRMSSWFSLEPFKYYFNVNNSYVLNKLKVLACPFLHRSWKRQVIRRDDMEYYCPPRDDVNAPDLYVPLMAFVTYVIVCGFVLGAHMRFHPELLGAYSSKGLAAVFFETLYIRAGFYFFENVVDVQLLDIVAYVAYLFVMLCINVLVGHLFGALAYYVCWLVTSFFMGTFLVRTLKQFIQVDPNVKTRDLRAGFLISIAAIQFLIAYVLGVLL